MKCPNCGNFSNYVVCTRRAKDGITHRRRHCNLCDHRWYTVQYPEISMTTTPKNKGIRLYANEKAPDGYDPVTGLEIKCGAFVYPEECHAPSQGNLFGS